jgi:hypothetical protein
MKEARGGSARERQLAREAKEQAVSSYRGGPTPNWRRGLYYGRDATLLQVGCGLGHLRCRMATAPDVIH